MTRENTVLLDRVARIGALVVAVGGFALPFALPLDGKPHSDFFLLVGRLHPLVLHLPVALLGLVPMLELGGVFPRWRHLRDFAGLALAIGAAGALLAMLAGYSLAYGAGMNDRLVTGHMWSGLALTSASILSLLVRRSWIHGRNRFLYPVLLAVTTGTLAWAAHQGGSVTHGETYLTDPLPASVKKLLGIPLPEPAIIPAADSAYALTVVPIFRKNCLSCHNATKTKGGLRLDEFSLLMKGGQKGPAVVAGHPEQSELLRRVLLPENDRQVMPPDGKPLLSPEERDAIRSWIADGASPDKPPAAGVAVPKKKGASIFAPVGDYAALAGKIRSLETRLHVALVPVSRIPADGLILRTRSAPERFDDTALASLAPVAPFVVEAELDHTRVTDAGLASLADYANLRALHLDHTAITGAGFAKLAGLKKLTYLNISSTKVTAEALATVKGIPNLYAFDTPAQPPPPPPVEPVKPAKPPMKAAVANVAASGDPVFDSTVAPVFAKNCVGCHGPAKTKGGLRLDTLGGVVAGGKSGPVFVAGKPDNSDLLRRVALPESDKEAMPPSGKPRLSAEQIAAIKSWVTAVKN